MELIERKEENYAVVFNVNLIRATLNEAVEFKECLAEAINNSNKDLVVNLSACEHLDSTFLGVLVSGYKKLKIQKRALVIIEPVDQSSIFLTLNSIGKIFPLYTSVQAALEDIENKKLLEKEINELSTEQIQVTEKLADNSLKLTDMQSEDNLMIAEEKELHNNEFQVETIQLNQTEETVELLHEKPDYNKGKSWNLIDFSEAKNNHLVMPEDRTENLVLEDESSSFEANREKEQQEIISHSRVVEETHFGSGPVKWEFGFSS